MAETHGSRGPHPRHAQSSSSSSLLLPMGMAGGSDDGDLSPRLSDGANSWDNVLLDHVDYATLLFDLDSLECLAPQPLAPALLTVSQDAASSADSRTVLHAVVSTRGAKSPSAATPAITGKKRTKQKDEVALLREQAPRLQAQLDHLIAYWKHKSLALMAQTNSSSSDRSTQDHDGNKTARDCAEPKWRTIAAHRRDELTAAELQNAQLSAQVLLHKRALHHIRKLLSKRVVSATVVQRQLDAFFQLDPQHMRVGSTCAFQMLLSESDSMYKSFPKVQHAMYLQQSHENEYDEERREWKLRQDAEHGTFIEMANRFVVPFDSTRVEKALRSMYAQRNGELRVYEFFKASEDMILTQFVASFRSSEGSGNVRARYAVRQFLSSAEDRSARFLITGLIERLEASGESKNLARLREKIWMIVTSCASSTPRQPVTVIQTYYIMAPEVSSTYCSDNLWNRTTIQQILIPNLDRSIAKSHRELEHELMNHGAKFRRQTLDG